jgi:hypothetical protein
MKKWFSTLSLLCLSIFGYSQTEKVEFSKQYYNRKYENQLYTLDYELAKQKLNFFILKNGLIVCQKNDYRASFTIEFVISESQFVDFDSIVSSLGYSTKENVENTNNEFSEQKLAEEIQFTQKQIVDYKELLQHLDAKSEQYLSCWNAMKELEKQAFDKGVKLEKAKKFKNNIYINLTVYDEVANSESSKISFVNMPGVEYSFLAIADPTPGISSNFYQGYFMKYMFTKGKSYASLGAYKSLQNSSSESQFNELFMFSFGQDFYSRHLGRGTRKFLNLYTGYQVGDIIATSQTTKSNILFVSPSIGLEVYKNKYILIDAKVNYFLPIQYNKELRGLSSNLSFNFVF